MAALFAFLHHAAAFLLVASLAVEFVLIKGELSFTNAKSNSDGGSDLRCRGGRRARGGIAASVLLRKGRSLLLPQLALHCETLAFRRCRTAVDLFDEGDRFMASRLEAGSSALCKCSQDACYARCHSLATGWRRSDSSLCGADGPWRRLLWTLMTGRWYVDA